MKRFRAPSCLTFSVTWVMDAQAVVRNISLPKKKTELQFGRQQLELDYILNARGEGGGGVKRRNAERCTAATRIYVFLFTGEIFFSFLPLRLCSEASSSSPVCCLAKLTNTCNNGEKTFLDFF